MQGRRRGGRTACWSEVEEVHASGARPRGSGREEGHEQGELMGVVVEDLSLVFRTPAEEAITGRGGFAWSEVLGARG